MSVDQVKAHLANWNLAERVQEFSVSSATVELAAKAVGVIPARIAKTLSFKKGAECILIVTAGDTKIDNSKYKQQFQTKAKMLSAEEVIAFTGHAIGGVCPFAIENPQVQIFTDVSLKRFATVFPACGSANSAVELTPEELFESSNSLGWVDVCKNPE